MNTELLGALEILEKEKNISKDTLLDAIEQSLIQACKNHYGKADNVKVSIDPQTCDFSVYAERTVVEQVEDPVMEISLENALKISARAEVGDVIKVPINSKEFGRIATQNAKNVILQKIREEERKVLYNQYYGKEKDVVTGIVQRNLGKNVSINLGKADALLNENEQVKTEVFHPTERIKVYILEVKDTPKGPRILVSRTHPELVKRLFESEVAEVREGIVEIKSIAREAGSRTKIAVWSNDPDVDPVGACVGMKGSRIHGIVRELRNENIDVINYTNNIQLYITRALNPAKINKIEMDEENKRANVYLNPEEVSLAIGKGGLNIKLASQLTGYEIDVYRELETAEEEDVNLEEFSDEIEPWVIEELKRVGCDTAKSVLELSESELESRTDLEIETIRDVLKILRAEFE